MSSGSLLFRKPLNKEVAKAGIATMWDLFSVSFKGRLKNICMYIYIYVYIYIYIYICICEL